MIAFVPKSGKKFKILGSWPMDYIYGVLFSFLSHGNSSVGCIGKFFNSIWDPSSI